MSRRTLRGHAGGPLGGDAVGASRPDVAPVRPPAVPARPGRAPVRHRSTTATSRTASVPTLALVAALAAPGVAAPASAAGPPVFEDATDAAGITFEQRSAPEKKYILESMSGGVALLDYDGDGLVDIYLVNSLTVETVGETESAPSALYRNLGGGRFEDVAEAAGVAYPGWGVGVCVGDVEGDGRPDLYVTGVGGNRLYRNAGDGTFEDVSEAAGVAADGWSAGCGFADYDRDGDVDLFVSRYVEVDLENLPRFGEDKTCRFRGIPVQCGPRGLPGTPDLLFRSDGDGTFTEVAEAAGVDDPEGYFGLGLAWIDFDEDGWLDLFVANDSNPNFLYVNRKDGTFEEAAFPLGVAVSEDGGEQGSMGVAVGDYANAGRFALFVTNFAEEYNALYRNHDGEYFTDASFRSATAPSSLPYVGWGTTFFDYDHDGLLDLLAVNGHVYPQLAQANLGASASYRQRKLLYRGLGEGKFEEVAEGSPVLMEERVSRGMAVGDLDGDGWQDAIVNDLDGRAQLLRNTGRAGEPGASSWLIVELVDERAEGGNRDALGAVVTVRTGETVQSRLVRSGTSYVSQDDLRQHFGLGGAKTVDALEVLWPDGGRTRVLDLGVDRVVRVPRGGG